MKIMRATLPPDQIIEARVDAIIARGAPLPRWGWKVPGSYNGATGLERVAGWQKVQIACRENWMPWPTQCSICGHDKHLHHHVEIYFRPMMAEQICRSCHYRVHRRFVDGQSWLACIPDRYSGWALQIPLVEFTRSEAQAIALLPGLFNDMT